MNEKDQFISELSQALYGKMSQAQINRMIFYFESQFMQGERKGKTQQQIAEELGDPRIVAKNVLLTNEKMSLQKNQKEEVVESVSQGIMKESGNFFSFKKADNHTEEKDCESKKTEKNDEAQSEEQQDFTVDYAGMKATFSKEKGWDLRLGGLKLNSWYGTLLIIAIFIVIAIIIQQFR